MSEPVQLSFEDARKRVLEEAKKQDVALQEARNRPTTVITTNEGGSIVKSVADVTIWSFTEGSQAGASFAEYDHQKDQLIPVWF